jgi:hypothetical protein
MEVGRRCRHAAPGQRRAINRITEDFKAFGLRLEPRFALASGSGLRRSSRLRQMPSRRSGLRRCSLSLGADAHGITQTLGVGLTGLGNGELRVSRALALWRSGALALWRSGALALWRSGVRSGRLLHERDSVPGEWIGRGSEALGLRGPPQRGALGTLLEGRSPLTGDPLPGAGVAGRATRDSTSPSRRPSR